MNEQKKIPSITLDKPSIHNYGLKPEARLVSWTPGIANLLHQVWEYATDWSNDKRISTPQTRFTDIGDGERDSYERTPIKELWGEEEETFLAKFLSEWMPITEMAQVTFELTNIPPALLQQISRHRGFSMFVRSGRVYRNPDWAIEGEFFSPDSLSEGNTAQRLYEDAMVHISDVINRLIELGVPVQDARGLMPMHSFYNMTLSCNLRTLLDVVSKRTCFVAQQELWAPMLSDMRRELCTKVSKSCEVIFHPPCYASGTCKYTVEHEKRAIGEIPYEVCPLFLAKHPDFLKNTCDKYGVPFHNQ